MICPKCKTVTFRCRSGKKVQERCRNRACSNYGQVIATVLEIREQKEEPEDGKTTDD